MIYVTLNKIRKHSPCEEGWTKLLKYLGKTKADDEPLALVTVLDSNGLDDALWCLRAAPEHSRLWRLLAVAYARKVQHLMTDERSIKALDVAERRANGLTTDDELAAARDEAWGAAWVAADVARVAAWVAAWAAEWGAAWVAADVARVAARDEARDQQAKMLREVLENN